MAEQAGQAGHEGHGADAHGRAVAPGGAPGAYVPGSMDIADHQRTYDAFITFVRRTVIVIVLLLLFLALVNA